MGEHPYQQTLQQRRAADAWDAVEDVGRILNEKMRREYGSLARGMPSLIRSDGLGHALAFLLAKAASERMKPHFLVYEHVSKWVCAEHGYSYTDDISWLLKLSTLDYRRATVEALAYLQWLKRFAEAKGWKADEAGD